jgi:aminocarboxymuconate-semialdehyde decarboxylase
MRTVFTCCAHAPETGHGTKAVSQRRHGRVIDIHCQLGVPAAETLVRARVGAAGRPMAPVFSSPLTDEVNRRQFQAIGRRLNTVEERLADMDRLGIDIQAISPSPGQYYHWTEPELGREVARLVNDHIADAVARHPDRLVGIGTVPLQARRCVDELGLRGIEISSNVAGRELAAGEFRPFFAAAESMGILLFLHPLGFTNGQRLGEHYFNNLIGNPLESTLAVAHLIFDGVLERLPDLKLCIAHGGGYLPSYPGRMDQAWRAREDCHQHIPHPPSHYLRRLYFDTLVFDPAQLDFLLRAYGPDHLLLGSDYPPDMGEPDLVDFPGICRMTRGKPLRAAIPPLCCVVREVFDCPQS